MKAMIFLSAAMAISLVGCVGNMNPTGGNSRPNYPYYVTQQPMLVKKIYVPAGTILTYEEQLFKNGKQSQIMPESKLTDILLPKDETINWGGVPVTMISQFFNSSMRGYSVYADFKKLDADKRTRFSQLWQSCDDDLGISIKDRKDWSFNKANIADVQSCSGLYQRYFKNDKEQQQFLDSMYSELMKINVE
ncbi:hypothetical protein MMP61_03105 [Acinetobacter sp. NIPH 1958]|uniref:hypothetical protein n=1 Tax=unclassified Acinetobacter TaxID=196816 RepID=UPI0003A4037D|nr:MULTISPECIES: hypothetical protein [unclassified Acinetobacter]MCH7352023.1 hypothetical protein [Acinetobacter sp. NIPH 2023]MCH7354578.1 hypothetical protein [Acinetobacter sp. NIPH 1958]MCH7359701.1 hypothetical protein [Acinetobacter sp. NIPH 2024]